MCLCAMHSNNLLYTHTSDKMKSFQAMTEKEIISITHEPRNKKNKNE